MRTSTPSAAKAPGSAPTTSPRPPVFTKGTHSEATKRTFIQAGPSIHTGPSWDGCSGKAWGQGSSRRVGGAEDGSGQRVDHRLGDQRHDAFADAEAARIFLRVLADDKTFRGDRK